MRVQLLPILVVLLALSPVAPLRAFAGQTPPAASDETGIERAMAVEPNVTVVVPKVNGRVRVRGWERDEVRAYSVAAKQIELRRVDNGHAATAAKSVRVVLSGEHGGDLHLNVPQKASVEVVAEESEVSIEGVAEARVESRGGDVRVRHVSQAIEANSVSGSILVQQSGGRVRLKTVSGSIEVTDVQPLAAGDAVQLNSVSGNFLLESTTHERVEAETTSGRMIFVAPQPLRAARYDLRTTSGDLLLSLAEGDAFQVSVRTGEDGRFVSDFPLTMSERKNQPGSRHLVGTRGTGGEAIINLFSYSGTVRLRKKTTG